jgi:hypothetical protein
MICFIRGRQKQDARKEQDAQAQHPRQPPQALICVVSNDAKAKTLKKKKTK